VSDATDFVFCGLACPSVPCLPDRDVVLLPFVLIAKDVFHQIQLRTHESFIQTLFVLDGGGLRNHGEDVSRIR
jgi:hypothetical protein